MCSAKPFKLATGLVAAATRVGVRQLLEYYKGTINRGGRSTLSQAERGDLCERPLNYSVCR